MIIDPLGTIPIERGGTGATTTEEACTNLGVASSDLSNVANDDFIRKAENSGVTETEIIDGGGGTVSGDYSFACGTSTAYGAYHFVAGKNSKTNNTSCDYSFVAGENLVATSNGAVFGKDTKGFREILVVGYNNIINSSNCGNGIVTGYNNVCYDKYSYYTLVSGCGLSKSGYQTIIGRFNTPHDGRSIIGDDYASLLVGNGTSDSVRSNALRTTTAGTAYGLNNFMSSGADFAEYFEWLDGNIADEDRRGYFVTLDGDKIRKATDKDEYILGVISAVPTIIGDSQSEIWGDMYLKDVFGEKLFETIEVEETKDEDGNIIPAHTEKRWILNPDYDSSLKYENRENRKEWSAVGLMGKLVVIDDGTCQVNGYCKPNENGIATASETGYRVMKRLDENHVRILL
jgi:hypothetical protein